MRYIDASTGVVEVEIRFFVRCYYGGLRMTIVRLCCRL
jgi:hypothetical protein